MWLVVIIDISPETNMADARAWKNCEGDREDERVDSQETLRSKDW